MRNEIPMIGLLCSLVMVFSGCESGEKRSSPVGVTALSEEEVSFSLESQSTQAAFPTRPGLYESGDWRYEYIIQSNDTRSEKRIGILSKAGEKLTGRFGEIRNTPVGRFMNFGNKGYSRGWLNTMTYDRPVFNPDGTLTEEIGNY